MPAERFLSVSLGQLDQGPQSVFAFLREFHAPPTLMFINCVDIVHIRGALVKTFLFSRARDIIPVLRYNALPLDGADMELVFLRHGAAADREDWKGDDADRPLTADGTDRTKEVVRGLKALKVKPDIILSSPLLR